MPGTLLRLCGAAASLVLAVGARAEVWTETFDLVVPAPTVMTPADGWTQIAIDGYHAGGVPGGPRLPQRLLTRALHPGVDPTTLRVALKELETVRLPGRHSIQQVPWPTAPGGNAVASDSRTISRETHRPVAFVELLGTGQQRNWRVARLRVAPVQYEPELGTVDVLRAAVVELTYEYDPMVRPACSDPAGERFARALPNYADLAAAYRPASPGPRTTYDYVIITAGAIASGSAKLDDYIAHKSAQGHAILVKTVEDIEAEYRRAWQPHLFETTDERADRIKAFLKDQHLAHGFETVLLIGNPDPDDALTASDTVGNVPMKFCYPDNHYGNKYAPTDQFYTDLTGRWDLNENGLFGEEADRASGGIDLATPELVVGRIPYYSANLAVLDGILEKIIAFELGADESWKRRCFMPNPIDYSDAYGAEGNLSPITMAEWIKEQVLEPEGFAYYRIYEHNFDYPPLNVSPPPERIPAPLSYVCFTRWDSSTYFKAGFNVASENIADYPITTMTDGSSSTAWTASNLAPGSFLQFKSNRAEDGWTYCAYRLVVRGSDRAQLPQQFRIEMAHAANFADAFVVATESDAYAHAVASGGYWELRYETPATLNRVGGKRYLRLTYTGAAPQASVRINEFLGYTEQSASIQPYVIPQWQQGYGVVYYNTHGWPQGASDIITSSECAQLDDTHPSWIFSKACSTAYPEAADNLCASFLFHGGIAAVGATRVSYGWGDMGYQLMMPKLVHENQPFGVVYGRTCADAAANNYYGWGGYFEDALRFNLYGDPTVRLLTDRDQDGVPYWVEEAGNLDPNDPDTDDDGWLDGADNCPAVFNPGQEDANDNGIGDVCEQDCNGNGVLDYLDLLNGTSEDCNENEVPDECDLAAGTSPDCNANLVPDECDLAAGTSHDENGTGIPDECELTIASVTALDDTTVRVEFSDAVDEASAEVAGHYAIDHGVAVQAAVLQPDGRSVRLTTTALEPAVLYTLMVSGVFDAGGEPVPPNTTATFVYHVGDRITSGLAVLYEFEEGAGDVVYDVSGVGEPLNLVIADPNCAAWTARGLVLESATIVSSLVPATKVISACMQTHALTIEAWIAPALAGHGGPAPRGTGSGNIAARNFTLGHGSDSGAATTQFDVRLRTTLTGLNGTPSVTTPTGIADTELMHVVYTRAADGTVRIYKNAGEVLTATVGGWFTGWNSTHLLALGNEITGARPWLGEYRLVAIYSRALTPAEVLQNYTAGPDRRPPLLPGDANCDGDVGFGDINAFVLRLTNPEAWHAQFPGCDPLNTDVNCDGEVSFADINPFVVCLSGGGCECP